MDACLSKDAERLIQDCERQHRQEQTDDRNEDGCLCSGRVPMEIAGSILAPCSLLGLRSKWAGKIRASGVELPGFVWFVLEQVTVCLAFAEEMSGPDLLGSSGRLRFRVVFLLRESGAA